MTNDSKENLLKILVNDPEEQPKQTSSNFEILDKITTFWQPPVTILPYNNFEIGLMADREIGVFNKEHELVLHEAIKINGNNATAEAITIDENGNLYALAWTNAEAKTFLVYLNNVTEKVEGEYKLVVKKAYDLSGITLEKTYIHDAYQDILVKCPLDSRFLILYTGTSSSSTQCNINAIEYHVNFNGENTYRAKQIRYTYDSSSTNVSPIGINVNWTDDDANITLLFNNSNGSYSSVTPGSTNIILGRFNLSDNNFNMTRLLYLSNYVNYYLYMPIAAFIDENNFYFATFQKNSNNNGIITIYYYTNGSLSQIYQATGTNTTSGLTRESCIIQRVNNLIFAGLNVRNIENNGTKSILLHIIGSEVKEFILDEQLTRYAENLLISNDFDIYYILCNNTKCRYLYTQNEYNNDPYFSKTSITSRNSILYDSDDNPIFSRKLYNKYIVGNSITSITQVPYNYLNDETIAKEELISMNNSVIDSEEKEITKNVYEELMINNIDAYKIYDNNNGSSYQQKPSLELTKNIFNGFQDNFKITNYRINYSDNTYTDEAITTIQRNGNIAIIYLYIYAEKEIDNIQLYNSSYTTPFITIKPNLELNKLYLITQKVKVE